MFILQRGFSIGIAEPESIANYPLIMFVCPEDTLEVSRGDWRTVAQLVFLLNAKQQISTIDRLAACLNLMSASGWRATLLNYDVGPGNEVGVNVLNILCH